MKRGHHSEKQTNRHTSRLSESIGPEGRCFENCSFTLEGKNPVFLRSKSYPAKVYYKKINKGNINGSFKCDSDETQEHIFQSCQPILSRISYSAIINLKSIYGSVDDQLSIIRNLTKANKIRTLMNEDILPGGLARTHVHT